MKNIKNVSTFIILSILVIAYQNCSKTNALISETDSSSNQSTSEVSQTSLEQSILNLKLLDSDNNNNEVKLAIDIKNLKMSVDENGGKRTDVELSKEEAEELKGEIDQNKNVENENLKNICWQLIRKKKIIICPLFMVAAIECAKNEVLVTQYRNGCAIGFVCKSKEIFECPLMPIAYPMCPNGKDPTPIYNTNECLIGYRCE